MLIADTRLSPTDEADLRWLWSEAAGDMGERSALGGQLDRLAEGRVSASQVVDAQEAAIRAAMAVERARKIERVLCALPHARHRITLRAALGPGLPSASHADLAGLATATLPLALLLLTTHRHPKLKKWLRPPTPRPIPAKATPEARAALEKANADDLAKWKAGRVSGLADLRQEATVALVAASHAYTEAAREMYRQGPTSRPVRML